MADRIIRIEPRPAGKGGPSCYGGPVGLEGLRGTESGHPQVVSAQRAGASRFVRGTTGPTEVLITSG